MNKKETVLLKVRNVKKYFNTPSGVIKAIDDVSFDVKQGEIVGLIGESGSGKTTVGRCLIRLYDGYSGFVSLRGQAISGNKLNKAEKMFLNQNMQMIFQDPHASLNGQQNIYTILKEPLIVNNIMKQEYKDFFKDWEDIIDNFKFTFEEEIKKLEVDTAIYHTEQALKLFEEWDGVFKKIKFRYEDIENDFNQYFAFKLTNQEREGNVISKIFRNNSKILDLYLKCQDEFRNNSILLIEQQMKKKKENVQKTILQSRMSDFDLRKMKLLKQYEDELNSYKETKKNMIFVHTSIIDSYVKEFKNSYVSHLESARSKTNYAQYNDSIKIYVVSKKIHDVLSKAKKNIIYLSSEAIDELINSLKKYRDKLIVDIDHGFKASSDKKYYSELKADIDNKFNFDISSYYAKSKKIENAINDQIHKLNKKITTIQWTFPEDRKSQKPMKNQVDIEQAMNEYLELEKLYEKENNEYSISFNQRMSEYNQTIIRELNKLNEIREKIKVVDQQFIAKHNEFLNGLRQHLAKQGKSKAEIKNNISIYDNKVKLKLETLQSFNVEITNLKKDLDKLKHLVGIKRSCYSKHLIKKILIKEKIYRSLEEVGLLRQFAWRYPHEFSGGQRQRIVIARALISNPKLIIADEPIASLDVSIQAQVVNILKELCEKKNVSLIFIAHDLSMVEYIADKILIMHLGKLIEFGKTEEIYSNPVHPYTINLFKSAPKISNANDKFESSSFELDYLEEQAKQPQYVDFYALNNDHIIYSTKEQFREWTSKEPKICEFTKNPNAFKN